MYQTTEAIEETKLRAYWGLSRMFLGFTTWNCRALSGLFQNWNVSKQKQRFCKTKQIFAKQNKTNVWWISMKQKFVSQHSYIYHILNAYFLREIISFKGYRAFVEAYDIVQWWWWHRRWSCSTNLYRSDDILIVEAYDISSKWAWMWSLSMWTSAWTDTNSTK